jgi:predicted alpha/beta superfamily hydrolase
MQMVANPLLPLGATEVHDLKSETVGDTFRVFLGHCGEDPRHTLFVTDANGLFGLVVDTVRLMQIPALLPPLLVVGIGYPDAVILADTVIRRPRDLAPTPSPKYFPGSGGAGPFLDFLTGELSGWVRQRHPGALGRTVYFGHSLGGLFGAHTLLDRPGAFDHLIISSPSLWWDHREIFRREEQYAATHDDLDARAYLAIGGLETDAGRRLEAAALPDGHHAKPPATHLDMVDDLIRFTDALAARGYPSLDLHREIIPNEFHNTVAGVVLTRGLRQFLSS